MEKYIKGMSFLVVAFVVAITSACDGADSSPAETDQSELDDNIQLWREAGKPSYQFTYSETCVCPPEEAIVQTIIEGTIRRAFYTPSGVYLPRDELDRLYTINNLFALIQAAITSEVDVLEVSYNQFRGYPESIFIDADENIADDETTYLVTDYQ